MAYSNERYSLLPTVTFLRRAVRTKRVKRLADLGFLGQEGGESEEVVFEIVFVESKSVFDTRLECWRLEHGEDVLNSGLGCGVGQVPTTTLAMLYITGFEHKNSDAGVRFSGV